MTLRGAETEFVEFEGIVDALFRGLDEMNGGGVGLHSCGVCSPDAVEGFGGDAYGEFVVAIHGGADEALIGEYLDDDVIAGILRFLFGVNFGDCDFGDLEGPGGAEWGLGHRWTQIGLDLCQSGDMTLNGSGSFDELVAAVYGELRVMARSLMRNQQPGHTLQPTALVNEAYLRLAQGNTQFENRAHFFGAAARAMRQVLVQYARKRQSLKRAGGAQRVTFSELEIAAAEPDWDVLALDEALAELERTDGRLCMLLELRYFTGLGLEEIAAMQGVSLSTVKRDWAYARAWLQEQLARA